MVHVRTAVSEDAKVIAGLLAQLGYPCRSDLLAAAEDLARQWGCLTMEVTSARARTDAHAFYQTLGYTDACDHSGRFLKELR
jgi:GNAT superfamily N-acetyltransferase